ncbi:hypothetical protein Tco_1411311 [Tanacetum coccineum]
MEIVEIPPTLKYRGGQLNAAPILEVENFTNWKKVVLVPYHCSGPKDLMFVKSLADNSKVSITGSNKPKLSGAEDFTLLNQNTGKVSSNESQRNTTDHSVVVSDSLATDYDSTDESSVYNTPLPPLEKHTDAEPVSGPKTIK